MDYKIFPGGLIVCFVLFSCAERRTEGKTSPLYFDVNSVINRQITLLDSLKPSLNKSVTIGSKTEVSAKRNVNWKSELDIFREADINSPELRETYDIKRRKEKNGYYSIEYISKETKRKGVDQLTINYDGENKLKNIFCRITSDSWFYSFERTLSMAFYNYKGLQVIETFNINNKEDLLFEKAAVSVLTSRLDFYQTE